MTTFSRSVLSARTASLVLFSALSLSASLATASPTFPSVVEAELGMPCTPDCTICHTDSPATSGTTAIKPFAIQVRNPMCKTGEVFPNCTGIPQGVNAGNTAALVEELARIETTQTDSDGDTLPDAVELSGTGGFTSSAGQLTTDPNTIDTQDNPSSNVCPPEPVYGCGAAHVTPRPHVHADLVFYGLLAAVLGVGLWRRSASGSVKR